MEPLRPLSETRNNSKCLKHCHILQSMFVDGSGWRWPQVTPSPHYKFISFIPRDQIGGSWGSLVPNQSQEIAQNTPITATFYLALYSMTKIMLQQLKFSPSHKSFLLIPRNSGYQIWVTFSPVCL